MGQGAYRPDRTENPVTLPSLLPHPTAFRNIRKVLHTIRRGMDPSIMSSPLPFLHTIERLKNTPRAGWVKRCIKGTESVSDHMYRMAIICMLLPKVGLLPTPFIVFCFNLKDVVRR